MPTTQRARRFWREERGSAVAEMTGAMFAFVFILMVIIQGGLLMHTAVTATNAAREGARAAVTLPPADPIKAVQRTAPNFPREVNVRRNGDSVTVTVRLKSPVLFDMLKDWDWWISGTTTMRVER